VRSSECPLLCVERTLLSGRQMSAFSRGCSLTRGLVVKLSVMHLPGSLFSPQ